MATAPFQLWMDLAPIATAVATGGTVTVTTSSSHGVTPGAYIQVAGFTDATGGTTMNGVAVVATVPSGTSLTYVLGGASGTAVVDPGVISYDLMNPPINYAAGTARQNAMIVDLESMNLSSNGDGSGSSMSFTVLQEITPSVGPWFNLVPDNTRFRFTQTNTGATPGTADIRFLGYLQSVNSQMNGAGQGNVTTVNLSDATTLLDKLGVFGKTISPVRLTGYYSAGVFQDVRIARSGGTCTAYSWRDPGLSVGQQIRVSGAAGGGTASFNGFFTISGTSVNKYQGYYSVKYLQSGPNAYQSHNNLTGGVGIQVSGSKSSNDRIRLYTSGTTNQLNIESGQSVGVWDIYGGTAAEAMTPYLSGEYSGDQVTKIDANTIELALPKAYTGTWPSNGSWSTIVNCIPTINDPVTNGQITVNIPSGTNETNAIKQLLRTVDAYHNNQAPLQRLFNTADTTQIAAGTANIITQDVSFPATTLRSALDSIIETYQGLRGDARARRYWIDLQGRLAFTLVDAASQPTYANAPYSITTASAGSPDTSSSKATVAPYSLSANWDHNGYKTALFSIPSVTGSIASQVFSYDELYAPGNAKGTVAGTAIYPTRAGAPNFDAIVEFPTAVKNPINQMNGAAVAYFSEQAKPLLSGQFELRGAGDAAWNALGLTSGYAQIAFSVASAIRVASTVTVTTTATHPFATGNTVVIAGLTGTAGTSMNGTATITVTSGTVFTYTSAGSAGTATLTGATGYGYALVTGWTPGQWVEVASQPLGLSGIYRVEQVNWSLEPGGTYLQHLQILFNRKNPDDLSRLIAGKQ